LAVI